MLLKLKPKPKLGLYLLFGLIGLFCIVAFSFFRWRQTERARLANQSQLIETSQGLIEYTSFGEGPAILVLHGTIGGYDQGQYLAEMLQSDEYQFISVSRPGYLRTPIESGATFPEQADAYIALLDELGISQVAVIAVSGGGPSALQMALNHPSRVWSMVMLSTNSDVHADNSPPEIELDEGETRTPPSWLVNTLFSDFFSWSVINVSKWQPRLILSPLVGEAYTDEVLNDPIKNDLYLELIKSFSLTSQRKVGSFSDGALFPKHTGYPFENIQAPMLILHGSEDASEIYDQQKYLERTVPNSTFVEINGGTHFMSPSHHEVLTPIILDFLEEHKP